MDIDELVASLERYNEAYRAGTPLVDDETYDQWVERLRQLDPEHPFLHAVEPEVLKARKEVRHPVPMLSTEKAYTREALEKFLSRVHKDAAEIGVTDVPFIVTPKLDGLSGRDDGVVFATRGNGEVGYEISSALDKGIVPKGGRGQGLGEIVVVQSYFDQHLATEFEHPRNMAVGIVSSDQPSDVAAKALSDGMVHFLPYSRLANWQGDGDALLADFDDITAALTAETDYPMDGMVVSVTNEVVKKHMGATAHHYRWQIAVKTKGATAVTIVEGLKWQVGRTGNVTPVLEIQPVALSGATIRRVSGHNAGWIRRNQIGIGAEIEIIRSGEVIPKLEKVLRPS
ncbi:MAG: DNA ligase, partial [Desulfobacterales bacterium]